MGIKVTWDNPEKTVLRQNFNGRWEIDELYHCIDKTHKLLSGLDHPVHIIIDLTNSKVPTNVLSAMRYMDSRVAPNQGIVVVVGADDYTETIMDVAKRLAPHAIGNSYQTTSLEDARRVILENVYTPELV